MRTPEPRKKKPLEVRRAERIETDGWVPMRLRMR
jgi:hypothetical protein